MSDGVLPAVSLATHEFSDPGQLCRRPKVSVLMLAYNHGLYLSDAIESVLGQRRDFEVELLIGEDCSTDDTRDIALTYQRKYPASVRVITADRNVGMHSNHQRLIKASRGEYLAYCEGDDYWIASDKLERQVAFLNSHPDYGAIHTEYAHIAHVRGRWRAVPRAWERSSVRIREGEILASLLRQNMILTCTVMLRANLVHRYLQCGLSIDSYPVADWPLFLFVSGKSKIGYFPEPLASYRKVPGSMTNLGSAVEVARVPSYMKMVDDFGTLFNLAPEVVLEAQNGMMTNLLNNALAAGDAAATRSAIRWLAATATGELPPARARVYAAIADHSSLSWLYRNARRVRRAIRELMAFTAQPVPPCRVSPPSTRM